MIDSKGNSPLTRRRGVEDQEEEGEEDRDPLHRPAAPRTITHFKMAGGGGGGGGGGSLSKKRLTFNREAFQALAFLQEVLLVKRWIEEVLEIEITEEVGDALADGTILCKLMNKVKPNSLTNKVHKSGSPAFMLMENINFFLTKCIEMGIDPIDTFTPMDLFEQKNIPKVIKCLVSVAECAAREGFKPTLARVEEALEVDFSDKELESASKIIEISNSAPTPPPLPRPHYTVVASDDPIDVALGEFINRRMAQELPPSVSLPSPILRIDRGSYQIGVRVISLKEVSGNIVVRVGGGWMGFKEFLLQYNSIVAEPVAKATKDSNGWTKAKTKKRDASGSDELSPSPLRATSSSPSLSSKLPSSGLSPSDRVSSSSRMSRAHPASPKMSRALQSSKSLAAHTTSSDDVIEADLLSPITILSPSSALSTRRASSPNPNRAVSPRPLSPRPYSPARALPPTGPLSPAIPPFPRPLSPSSLSPATPLPLTPTQLLPSTLSPSSSSPATLNSSKQPKIKLSSKQSPTSPSFSSSSSSSSSSLQKTSSTLSKRTPSQKPTSTLRHTPTSTPRSTSLSTPHSTLPSTPRSTATSTPRSTLPSTPRPTATPTSTLPSSPLPSSPRPTQPSTPRPTATSTPRSTLPSTTPRPPKASTRPSPSATTPRPHPPSATPRSTPRVTAKVTAKPTAKLTSKLPPPSSSIPTHTSELVPDSTPDLPKPSKPAKSAAKPSPKKTTTKPPAKLAAKPTLKIAAKPPVNSIKSISSLPLTNKQLALSKSLPSTTPPSPPDDISSV